MWWYMWCHCLEYGEKTMFWYPPYPWVLGENGGSLEIQHQRIHSSSSGFERSCHSPQGPGPDMELNLGYLFHLVMGASIIMSQQNNTLSYFIDTYCQYCPCSNASGALSLGRGCAESLPRDSAEQNPALIGAKQWRTPT